MKPNKTLFGAFVISVTLIIGACQQTELSDSAPTPSFPAPAAEFVADDSDLSAGDAAAVARIFRNGNRPTRAGSDAVILSWRRSTAAPSHSTANRAGWTSSCRR